MNQPAQKDRPTMVSINQLIALNYLPGRAIRRLITHEKRIPSVVVGNRRYVNLAVFERYLANGDNDERAGI